MRKACRGCIPDRSRFSSWGVGTAPGSGDKLDLLMNAHFKLNYSFPLPLSVGQKLLKSGSTQKLDPKLLTQLPLFAT